MYYMKNGYNNQGKGYKNRDGNNAAKSINLRRILWIQ